MNPRNNNHKYYDASSIDAFAFYSPKEEECYWISEEEAPKTKVTLAIDYKQKQNSMRIAENYILSREKVRELL